MGNSCCSSDKAFRFKNFVVAVYPKEEDGEPNKDALGKLESYVANNTERIPRVCRKIVKLISRDLSAGYIKRVGVGVHILTGLIEQATELETFVPYATGASLQLFESGVVENRIGAAEIISVLCYRIVEKSSASPSANEQARRLVSDVKDQLSSHLRDMCVEGVGTNDVISLHCRYAAIVTLGNLAACIQSSLAPNVNEVLPAILSNFHHLVKEQAVNGSTRVNQRRRQRSENLSTGAVDDGDYRTIATVVLPVEANEKDQAFFKACLSAIAALASCCSSALVTSFLSIVSQYCSTFNAWCHPRFPTLIYRAITVALQKRAQPLGINVCQHLCELVEESCATERLTSILRCLATAVPQLPMTSGRPQPVLQAMKTVVATHLPFSTAAGASQSNSGTTDECRQALLNLCSVLSKRVVSQGNVSQMGRISAELCLLLGKQTHKALIQLTLELLGTIAPLASELPVEEFFGERYGSISVVEAVLPYLNLNDELRVTALNTLIALIAPSPTTASEQSDAVTPVMQYIVSEAKHWLCTSISSSTHTPQSVAAVSNLIAAITYRLRWNSVNFVIPLVASFQLSNGAASANQMSALNQAWLYASVAAVSVMAEVLKQPKLASYAKDVLARRKACDPSELGIWLQNSLAHCTPTGSGLMALEGEYETQLASIPVPPVTNLLSISTIAVYLAQGPDSQEHSLLDIFSVSDSAAVVGAIERLAQDLPQQFRSRTSRQDLLLTASSGSQSVRPNSAKRGSLIGTLEDTTLGILVASPHSGNPSSRLSGTGNLTDSTNSNSSSGLSIPPCPVVSSISFGEFSAADGIYRQEKIPVVKDNRNGAEKIAKLSGIVAQMPPSVVTNTPPAFPFTPKERSVLHKDPYADALVDEPNVSHQLKNSSFTPSLGNLHTNNNRFVANFAHSSIVLPTAKTIRLNQKTQTFHREGSVVVSPQTPPVLGTTKRSAESLADLSSATSPLGDRQSGINLTTSVGLHEDEEGWKVRTQAPSFPLKHLEL